MKRTLSTLITLGALSIARASDMATTFHFNPSLSHEANPIVARMGAGVATFQVTNVLAVFVLLVVPLFVFWRYPAQTLPSTPASLREFICLQLYGRVLSPAAFLRSIFLGVPLPKNWLQAVRLMGFAGSWTVAFGSFLAVLSWWAIQGWHWQSYQTFRDLFVVAKYPVLEVLLSIGFFFLISSAYFRMEFAALRNPRNR